MILVSHAIVGGAVGSFFPQNPLLAFFAGLLSHFVLDAIPHWEYQIKSINSKADSSKGFFKIGWGLVWDVIKISADFFLGFLLAILIFGKGNYSDYSVFAGALGGVFPDSLLFLSYVWRTKILMALRKFHLFIHSRVNWKSHPVLGILSQMAVVSAIILIVKLI
jgi:hypothetical protein